MLAECGGYIELNRFWARSHLRRMNFVQRKVSTAKSKHTVANLAALKRSFLIDFHITVTMEEIPAELIFNWDQTGIKLVPCSSWIMEQHGSKRVEMVGANDKRQITAIFVGQFWGNSYPSS